MLAQTDTAGLSGGLHGALRPERLRLSRGAATGPNAVAGQVSDSAYRGIVVDHRVSVGPDATLLVSQPLGDGAGVALPPGEAVCVSWTPDACILLPE